MLAARAAHRDQQLPFPFRKITGEKKFQKICQLPLQIDTASPEAMEAALRQYNGIPLINSVNGREESMSRLLPLAKRYGGVLIALTLDGNGRFLISKRYQKLAAIEQDIKFIGMGDTIEIWSQTLAEESRMKPEEFGAALEEIMCENPKNLA